MVKRKTAPTSSKTRRSPNQRRRKGGTSSRLKKNVYVLDTSALLQDPTCLTHYTDSTIIIPVTVLGELDKHKGRMDAVGKNAREVPRILYKYKSSGTLLKGIIIPESNIEIKFCQEDLNIVPESLDRNKPDDRILSVCLTYKKDPKNKVYLVTNDLYLSLKAEVYDISALEFKGKGLLKNVLEYQGYRSLVETSRLSIDKLYTEGNIKVPKNYKFHENEFCLIYNKSKSNQSVRCRYYKGNFRLVDPKISCNKVKPLNNEQAYVMDLLFDPDIPLVTITGKAGTGKAQPLDSLVLTDHGFKPMGEIKKGSIVITPKGNKTKVLDIFPQGKKDVYSVEFADGRKVECCEDHLWPVLGLETDQKNAGHVGILSLRDFIQWRKKKSSRRASRGRIPLVKFPVTNKNAIALEIKPYTFGCLLGDGSFRPGGPTIASGDKEIIDRVRKELGSGHTLTQCKGDKYTYRISYGTPREQNKLVTLLKSYGLWECYSDEKFIPEVFLSGSLSQKLELLQGLLDTDGHVDTRGTLSFSTTSKVMSRQVQQLVWELGGIAKISTRIPFYYGKNREKIIGKKCYTIRIRHSDKNSLVVLSRKKDRLKKKDQYSDNLGLPIKNIKLVGKKECQCILVEDREHLYVTDNYIVTHNTLLSVACGLEQVIGRNRLYKKMVVSRSLELLSGRDKLGYLKGGIDEKLAPFILPLRDAVDFVIGEDKHGFDYLQKDAKKLEIEPLQYIRGRSITNTFFIVDEVQNLTKQDVKTIITRMGQGSKIILLGDLDQIDNSYITKTTNGLAQVIEKFKNSPLAGHIELAKGVRSSLATEASILL